MVSIAILVPTFNRCHSLRQLLECLCNQEPYDFDVKVIVVVDGSADGTLEMLENTFPKVHVVVGNGTWWYTRSINMGYQLAKKFAPDFILTLNDDIILTEGYLKALIESRHEVEEDSILGSISLTVDEPHKITFSGVHKINKWIDKTTVHIPYMSAFNNQLQAHVISSILLPGRGLLIPSHIMEELNGFDESFFQYQSDYDFCLRAAKKGYKSYISYKAIVYSHEKQTASSSTSLKPRTKQIVGSLFKKTSRYYLLNRSRYYWKHYYKLLWPLYMIKYIISILNKSKIFSA